MRTDVRVVVNDLKDAGDACTRAYEKLMELEGEIEDLEKDKEDLEKDIVGLQDKLEETEVALAEAREGE